MRTRYFVPLGRMQDYPHPAPDRTATKAGAGIFADIECRIWTSRGAMLAACAMSSQTAPEVAKWRPLLRQEDAR